MGLRLVGPQNALASEAVTIQRDKPKLGCEVWIAGGEAGFVSVSGDGGFVEGDACAEGGGLVYSGL